MTNTKKQPAAGGNPPQLTIDERILAIEAALPNKLIPGTTLTRVMQPVSGVQWCLSLGSMGMPKTFFHGLTIEDVITQGETAIAEMKAQKGNRLKTGWDSLNEALEVEFGK